MSKYRWLTDAAIPEVNKLMYLTSVRPRPMVAALIFLYLSALSVQVLASTPSIEVIRKEILILDRAKRAVKQQLPPLTYGNTPAAQASQYIQYIDSRITALCSQAMYTSGATAIADLPCPPPTNLLPGYERPAAGSHQDRIRAMDRRLLESLGDFDDMLAAERRKVRADSPEAAGSAPGEPGTSKSTSGAHTAGKGQGGERRAPGIRIGTSEGRQGRGHGHDGPYADASSGAWQERGPGQIGEAQGHDRTAQQAQGNMPAGTGREAQDRQQGPHAAKGQAGTVPGVGTESASDTGSHDSIHEDDDIVARQLREAAEKETDPELKKKLWEEYRRYKESRR